MVGEADSCGGGHSGTRGRLLGQPSPITGIGRARGATLGSSATDPNPAIDDVSTASGSYFRQVAPRSGIESLSYTCSPSLACTMKQYLRPGSTANHTRPVQIEWLAHRLGLSTQALREDRILHEVHATGGDIRRLCDLFGLSIGGAERYLTIIDPPDIRRSPAATDDKPTCSPGETHARRHDG
jgi:hypothetical protein